MGNYVTVGKRLKEERERLGFNQTDFAAVGGVGRKSQFNYEEDERKADTAYLEAIASVGADVRYIITGEREGPAPEVLASDERLMLDRFRTSPQSLRDAALRVLLGGESATPKARQVFHGAVGSSVNVEGNLDQRGVTFSVGGKRKK